MSGDRKPTLTTVRLIIGPADYGRPRITPIADAILNLLALETGDVLEVRVELDLLRYVELGP